MALSTEVYRVLEEQEALVLKIDDPKVTEYAKKLAFYQAMYDAALDDPMDLSADQDEILGYFGDKVNHYVECYQALVNEHL